jgi:hypothetical protein
MKKTNKCVLPGAETLTPEEQMQILQKTCSRVVHTEDGKIFLNMLLTDLHFFDICTTENEKALNEYAKFLIRYRLGVSNTLELSNMIAETAGTKGV